MWLWFKISFPDGSEGKESAFNAGDPSSILGQEDPLEKEMATQSSILTWKIPWTEEPGELQSMGSQSRTRLSDTFNTLWFKISIFCVPEILKILINVIQQWLTKEARQTGIVWSPESSSGLSRVTRDGMFPVFVKASGSCSRYPNPCQGSPGNFPKRHKGCPSSLWSSQL